MSSPPARHSAAPPGPNAFSFREPSPGRIAIAFAFLAAVVSLVYSNHFHNAFHFDDTYTIQQNPYIRDLRNVPLFFTDVRTNSALDSNRTYRPLLVTSLAFDYWMGRGLDPFWFHASTYVWFLTQLAVTFLFFRRVLNAALPKPDHAWLALFATAVYGLHPVTAETVNYIVQRADLYCTLGVTAGLLIWMAAPGLRVYGVYLLPVIAGLLSKQPAAVFPVLLLAWVWLFEEEDFRKALIRCLPAFAVTGAAALFVLKMNPASYVAGSSSAFNYRISQPAVLLTYFRKFFLPTDLSADTDRVPYTKLLDIRVLAGFLFLALVAAAVFYCRKRRETRPIAFGLFWFLVSSLPTSVIALAEVENDHRMYFPFVGLAIAVCQAAALLLRRFPLPRAVTAGICALLLTALGIGSHERNKVWQTDEALWRDVTEKSPANGRGLMNYGLTQMDQGHYQTALEYFNRALAFDPDYYVLQVNLGVAYAALHNNAEAERHYTRAIELAPAEDVPRYFFARWLNSAGRTSEALANLRIALERNPGNLDVRYLLMQIYADLGDAADLRQQASETLAILPGDATASSWLARSAGMTPTLRTGTETPESYLSQSVALYRAGRFQESISAAREALKLRPGYAAAWNNIMAAYNALSDWDDAIAAGEKAVSLDPANELARNNLAAARAGKARASNPAPAR